MKIAERRNKLDEVLDQYRIEDDQAKIMIGYFKSFIEGERSIYDSYDKTFQEKRKKEDRDWNESM